MNALRTLVDKLNLGEHLTDEEMISLQRLYQDAYNILSLFGGRYQLVYEDVSRNLDQINKYVSARKIYGNL